MSCINMLKNTLHDEYIKNKPIILKTATRRQHIHSSRRFDYIISPLHELLFVITSVTVCI